MHHRTSFLLRLTIWPAIIIALVGSLFVYYVGSNGYNEMNLLRPAVEKAHCSCDCWDGFFKGNDLRVSSGTGETEYKAIYFNFEPRVLLLVYILTIVVLITSRMIQTLLNCFRLDLARLHRLKREKIADIGRLRTLILYLKRDSSIRVFAFFNYYLLCVDFYAQIWSLLIHLNEFADSRVPPILHDLLIMSILLYQFFKCFNRYVADVNEDKNITTMTTTTTTVNKIQFFRLYPIGFLSISNLYTSIIEERALWGLVFSDYRSSLLADSRKTAGDFLRLAFVLYYSKFKPTKTSGIGNKKENTNSLFNRLSTSAFHLKLWFLFTICLFAFQKNIFSI